MKWICSQIGAREHYAIPRALHPSGKLEALYTDIWAGSFWRALGSCLGRPILQTRYHPELETARVESFNFATLTDFALGGNLQNNPYEWFLYQGREFGRSILDSLINKKRVCWGEIIFFGYDTGFLEPALWVKNKGGKSIVCQMDPSRMEIELVMEEERLWPGWSKKLIKVPEVYLRRREREWTVADIVVVNSEWTKTALSRQGVPESKIHVIPLAYETTIRLSQSTGVLSRDKNSPQIISIKAPIRVLFLGQVILRKGIQYLIEAAAILQNQPVIFDVVGPLGITEMAIKTAPSNMIFHGPISRIQATKYFANARIFVLPTLSDGFAITQLEAMAHGLPVITTANCGKVVTDGIDGLIVPTRNAIALADAIRSLIDDPAKLESMSIAAREKSESFTLSQLGKKLAILQNHLMTQP